MHADLAKPIEDLRKLMADLESLATSTVGRQSADFVEHYRDALSAAQERIKGVEQSLGREAARGAKAADHYVREHVWLSIGVAAVVAFALGAFSGRRD